MSAVCVCVCVGRGEWVGMVRTGRTVAIFTFFFHFLPYGFVTLFIFTWAISFSNFHLINSNITRIWTSSYSFKRNLQKKCQNPSFFFLNRHLTYHTFPTAFFGKGQRLFLCSTAVLLRYVSLHLFLEGFLLVMCEQVDVE